MTDETDTKKDTSDNTTANNTDAQTTAPDTADANTVSNDAANDADAVDTTTTTTGQSVVVQIPGGSDSASVCRVLQNAGAIDDASAFDAYLVSRGLDRYIRSGTYYITAGSSYEDIAKLITGR